MPISSKLKNDLLDIADDKPAMRAAIANNEFYADVIHTLCGPSIGSYDDGGIPLLYATKEQAMSANAEMQDDCEADYEQGDRDDADWDGEVMKIKFNEADPSLLDFYFGDTLMQSNELENCIG